MPGPTLHNLASAARSVVTELRSKASATTKLFSTSTKNNQQPSTSSLADLELKNYLSSISSSDEVSKASKHLLKNSQPPPPPAVDTPPKANSTLHGIFRDSFNPPSRIANDEAAAELSTSASSLLDELKLDWEDEHEHEANGAVLDFPWLAKLNLSPSLSLRRQEISRIRKQKWVYKSSNSIAFNNLLKMCGKKLGSEATIDLFEKLRKESGLQEYIAFIHMCVKKARAAIDEDASLDQLYKIHQLFMEVQEYGLKIHEKMYRELLLYLIEFGMVQEFFFFHQLIIDENPESLTRLAYYEMLLWVRVDNEVKIQELCHSAIADGSQEKSQIQENLLMALCESDRKEEIFMLLQALDITKFTSFSCLLAVFGFLGKFSLESVAEQYMKALKNSGAEYGAKNISNIIYDYAVSIPNLSVEDTIKKFHTLHAKLDMLPTSAQYEKLIKYSCNLQKVHEALQIFDQAFRSGVSLSLGAYHLILNECIHSCELNVVHQAKSMISRHNLKPDPETFRMMMVLYVKMKDFDGAYGVINDMVKSDLKLSAVVYNVLLYGLFREKNITATRNVLKEMEDAGVKPDAMTYSCLIASSTSEKDIIKFYEQMISDGVPVSKQVFDALINAYAAFGLFEKAKEVALDKRIPPNGLNEIKSMLIGALASKGQFSSALKLYEDMKKSECDVDLKAIRTLIENFDPEGDLDKMLQLLEELNDSIYWMSGCFNLISYCLKQENLRYALDLIKQLMDKVDYDTDVIFDEVFSELVEKTDMQFGLSLLNAVKEELGVTPSRKALDFLLSGCVNAKDTEASFVIWKEYELAGLPYNVLSYLRMYQALLASGDAKSAAKILYTIPKDDPHVSYIINACPRTYGQVESIIKEKNKLKWQALSNIMFP